MLLCRDSRDGDERNTGRQCRPGEPAAAESLQLVSVAEWLADPFEALGKHPDKLACPQQPLRLGGLGWHMAAGPRHPAEQRDRVHHVGAQQPQVPPRWVLVENSYLEHDRIEREDA